MPTVARLSRPAPLRSREVSSRDRAAGVVADLDAGDWFGRLPWRIFARLPRTSPPRSPQSGAAATKGISRNRKLDGRRDSVARQDCAVDSGRQTHNSATLGASSRHALRIGGGAVDYRARFRGAAAFLVNPSTLEARRKMFAPRNAAPARNDRRAHHGVVSALSKVIVAAVVPPRLLMP